MRTIIAWRHGARGRANNERAPSYFHEMSHQIMAGCERAGKEQRPAAAGHKVKLRADRDSSGSLDRGGCWPNTHTHTHTSCWLLVRQIGSGSDDNVESWVNFLSRTRSRATELVSTVLSVAHRERCSKRYLIGRPSGVAVAIDVYLRPNDGCAWTSSS